MQMRRKSQSKEQGQVLIEFALVLPLLATLFVVLLHYGIVFWVTLGVSSSVREAALFAAYNPDNSSSIVQTCVAAMPTFLDTTKLTITVTSQNVTRSEGTSISVTASYDISAAGSLPGGQFLPTPSRIGAAATSPILVP